MFNKKKFIPKLRVILVALGGVLLFTSFLFKLEKNKKEPIKAVIPEKQVSGSESGESEKSRFAKKENEPLNNHESKTGRAYRSQKLKKEVDLKVPFTVQSPFASWDEVHEETCEEAAVLMAGRYFQGRKISGKKDAFDALSQLIKWENERFGYYKDTTAQETATLLKEFYGLRADVVSWDEQKAKENLASGNLVLTPTAGRKLNNPYFKRPGPIYHMLVLRGYKANGDFLVNDPGTKRGERFTYKVKTLNSAVHDWNSEEMEKGEQVMIVVAPKL